MKGHVDFPLELYKFDFFFLHLSFCLFLYTSNIMQSAQTELDFINLYLESLSNKSVRYGDDYMQRVLPKPLKIKVDDS